MEDAHPNHADAPALVEAGKEVLSRMPPRPGVRAPASAPRRRGAAGRFERARRRDGMEASGRRAYEAFEERARRAREEEDEPEARAADPLREARARARTQGMEARRDGLYHSLCLVSLGLGRPMPGSREARAGRRGEEEKAEDGVPRMPPRESQKMPELGEVLLSPGWLASGSEGSNVSEGSTEHRGGEEEAEEAQGQAQVQLAPKEEPRRRSAAAFLTDEPLPPPLTPPRHRAVAAPVTESPLRAHPLFHPDDPKDLADFFAPAALSPGLPPPPSPIRREPASPLFADASTSTCAAVETEKPQPLVATTTTTTTPPPPPLPPVRAAPATAPSLSAIIRRTSSLQQDMDDLGVTPGRGVARASAARGNRSTLSAFYQFKTALSPRPSSGGVARPAASVAPSARGSASPLPRSTSAQALTAPRAAAALRPGTSDDGKLRAPESPRHHRSRSSRFAIDPRDLGVSVEEHVRQREAQLARLRDLWREARAQVDDPAAAAAAAEAAAPFSAASSAAASPRPPPARLPPAELEFLAEYYGGGAGDVAHHLAARLHRGAVVVKYGRKGQPHLRRVWVSADMQSVRWAPLDEPARADALVRVCDLERVTKGCASAVFERNEAAGRLRLAMPDGTLAEPRNALQLEQARARCFSLHLSLGVGADGAAAAAAAATTTAAEDDAAQRRTLDLQVLRGSCNEWASLFEYAVTAFRTNPEAWGRLRTAVDDRLAAGTRRAAAAAARDGDGGDPTERPRRLLQRAARLFNANPRRGVRFARESGIMAPLDAAGEDATTAAWLHGMAFKGLDREAVGRFFSRESSAGVLRAYIAAVDMSRLGLVDAMRALFLGFRPVGEAPVISRVLDEFSRVYHASGPPDAPWRASGPDTVLCLSFAVLMLNTDLHSPSIKHKMTLEQFVRNCRGIDDGRDVDAAYLERVYETLLVDPLRLERNEGDLGARFSEAEATARGWVRVWLPKKLRALRPGEEPPRPPAGRRAYRAVRAWAVLTGRRAYLFSDADEACPRHVIEVGDGCEVRVLEPAAAPGSPRRSSSARSLGSQASSSAGGARGSQSSLGAGSGGTFDSPPPAAPRRGLVPSISRALRSAFRSDGRPSRLRDALLHSEPEGTCVELVPPAGRALRAARVAGPAASEGEGGEDEDGADDELWPGAEDVSAAGPVYLALSGRAKAEAWTEALGAAARP